MSVSWFRPQYTFKILVYWVTKSKTVFRGFFFLVVLCFDTCGCVNKTVCKTCGWPKQSHGFFLSFFELFLHICAKETVGKTLWLVQTVSRFFPQFSLCFDVDALMRQSVKPCGSLFFSSVFFMFLYRCVNETSVKPCDSRFFSSVFFMFYIDVLMRRSVKPCGSRVFSSVFFMFWYRCVNETVCKTLWLAQTSDQDQCIQYGTAVTSGDFSCHFCCFTDKCNQGLIPEKSTFYTVA